LKTSLRTIALDEEVFTFGSFRLVPAQRTLLDDGKPLRLGSRALDILITLVERTGETISKEELIARAWPDTVVEEASLRVHVAALRKALGGGRAGKRYIVNLSGRGYAFVAPVTREHQLPATAPPNGTDEAGNLPVLLTRVVGRDGTISALITQLARRRFLTIVGPGGIGKTTVAITVADRARASYENGAWYVELAPLSDLDLVPSALCAVLGMSVSGGNPLSALIAWLRDKHILLVLDNCEHVIGAAAALAETVLKAAPGVSILTTSREPLRAEGETLHRLAALDLPSNSVDLTTADALRYSAIQLFNERAMAAVDSFALADADVPAVFEICRRLDGIPLALELAAARVGVFGVSDLAAQLDDRFHVLMSGRRTALPRHQTLRAVLDWSYQLLPEEERTVLRRLSVFAGDFSLDAAVAVNGDLSEALVLNHIANLVAKSLVVTNLREGFALYRLLDTTRAYSLDKLRASDEFAEIARRHAEYYRALFAPAEAECESLPQEEWLGVYGRHLGNVRAALDWALSADGDPQIGVALTVVVVPLWMQLSLLGECRERIERALAWLNSIAANDRRLEMQLYATLGMSLNYTTGPVRETAAAWTKTLMIAKSLGDTEYQLRALRGLWAHHMNGCEYRRALSLANEFRGLAATLADPTSLDFGDRMAALILHYMGDQNSARSHLAPCLARAAASIRHSQTTRFLLDRDVTVQALWSRILWLQGFSDQASRAARLAVDRAMEIGHALSLCHALAQAMCPVAIYTGDLDCAEGSVTMLLDNARERGLAGWIARGHCFLGIVMLTREDFAGGLPLLRDALAELRERGASPSYPSFLAILAGALGRAAQVVEGLATIDRALILSKDHEEHWCLPEVLRIRGELTILEDAADAHAVAERHFLESLSWANRQQALAWELRTATSLARLWRRQRRVGEARELLGPVYDRFTEGFGTADLQRAKNLLEQLALAD
jgi:predicted ATPase/DNA-binding winged helix-turn-helix (wHTH) protein